MVLSIFIPLFVSLLINYLVMYYSWIKKTNHYLDLTYALTFFVLGLFSLLYNTNYTYQMFFILTIILFWAIRLSTYLYTRIKINKGDERLQNFLKSFKKFFILWTIQAAVIWLILFPIYFLAYYKIKGNIYFIILIFVAFLFLYLESIADYQKFMHKKKTSKKIITTGVWKYSRHMNYFAEISFWATIAIFVILNNFNLISLISLIGPLTIILIIYKVSGLPMLEKNQHQKHKNDITYKKYIKVTSCLIPFIGKKGPYKNLK